MSNTFSRRLLPAPRVGGFALDDHWVWCGSPVRGDDGRYHLFASRWTKALPFDPHWVTNSEVVRAASETPAGPYRFEAVVLPSRGREWWDGLMTHNPTIHRAPDGTFLLFYTGTTYDFDVPTRNRAILDKRGEQFRAARQRQRIGLATAPSVLGPWKRRDQPVLHPRPGQWDALMTTNAAPCVLPDGSIRLAYKSTGFHGDLLRYGIATADHYDAPFTRLRDTPIFDFGPVHHVEDACLWREAGLFHLLLKDMTGGICGEKHAGIHATSEDAINWRLADPPLAYSLTVRWDGGSTTRQGCLERPQLLIEHGVPTHLFAATCDGPGGFNAASRTWTMCIPLA